MSECADERIYCIYCDQDVTEGGLDVPGVDDDEAWEVLAQYHALDCEWIETRSYRLE